jgi:uncharacterized membrane protein
MATAPSPAIIASVQSQVDGNIMNTNGFGCTTNEQTPTEISAQQYCRNIGKCTDAITSNWTVTQCNGLYPQPGSAQTSAYAVGTGTQTCGSGDNTCIICVHNYATANAISSTDPYINNVVDCCLNNIDGWTSCGPGWCSTTTTNTCDQVFLEKYTNGDITNLIPTAPPDQQLYDFCSTAIPGTVPNGPAGQSYARWEAEVETPHWCSVYAVNYCTNNPLAFFDVPTGLPAPSTNDPPSGNPFCYGATNNTRANAAYTGLHPLWADTAALNWCTTVYNNELTPDEQTLFSTGCSCINAATIQPSPPSGFSTLELLPVLSCAYDVCRENDFAYRPNPTLNPDCGTICSVVISASGKGVNFGNNTVVQNCGSDVVTNYYCDSDNNQCTIIPTNTFVGTGNYYKNDSTCGGQCQSAPPSGQQWECTGGTCSQCPTSGCTAQASDVFSSSGACSASGCGTTNSQWQCTASGCSQCPSTGCVGTTGLFPSSKACSASCGTGGGGGGGGDTFWKKYKVIILSLIAIVIVLIIIAVAVHYWKKKQRENMKHKKQTHKTSSHTHVSPNTSSKTKIPTHVTSSGTKVPTHVTSSGTNATGTKK